MLNLLTELACTHNGHESDLLQEALICMAYSLYKRFQHSICIYQTQVAVSYAIPITCLCVQYLPAIMRGDKTRSLIMFNFIK